jgi:hypothetical protein
VHRILLRGEGSLLIVELDQPLPLALEDDELNERHLGQPKMMGMDQPKQSPHEIAHTNARLGAEVPEGRIAGKLHLPRADAGRHASENPARSSQAFIEAIPLALVRLITPRRFWRGRGNPRRGWDGHHRGRVCRIMRRLAGAAQ